MKKKIISCLVIIVVIVLSYFYAHIDKNSYIYNRHTENADFISTGILNDGEELVQTFRAEEDAIDGINVKVSVPNNSENVVLHYEVVDVKANKVVSSKISASKLDNNKFNLLKVPRIEDTKGKSFAIVLKVECDDESQGLAFYLEPGRQNNNELDVKGNSTDATLIARSVCHRFDVETFVVLLGMITFIVGFMKVLYKFFK